VSAWAGHGSDVQDITLTFRLVSKVSSRSMHSERQVSLVPARCQMRDRCCKGKKVIELRQGNGFRSPSRPDASQGNASPCSFRISPSFDFSSHLAVASIAYQASLRLEPSLSSSSWRIARSQSRAQSKLWTVVYNLDEQGSTCVTCQLGLRSTGNNPERVD
jgi:hypothetical protein